MSNDERGTWKAINGKPGLRRHTNTERVQARYRASDGNFRTKTFGTSTDAQKWLRQQRVGMDRGEHIDPRSGKVTFQDYAEQWLAGHGGDPSTREAIELRLRLHVFPSLGSDQLRAIKPTTIRAWLTDPGFNKLAASTRLVVFQHVSAALSAAVDDECIAKNPCKAKSVNPPKPEQRKVIPWPVADVLGVHKSLPKRYKILVSLAAGLGLRQGEVFGLSPDDIDFLRGKVEVRRQVKLIRNRCVFGLPKGGKTRTVPLPGSVRDELAAYLAEYPAHVVTLPWGQPGGQETSVSLVVTTSRDHRAVNRNRLNSRIWKPALEKAGIEPSRENGMHALRHFYASTLLDAGESIKAVSEFIGHGDPGFTLRTYTHLMPASDERTRKAIDVALGKSVTPVSSSGTQSV